MSGDQNSTIIVQTFEFREWLNSLRDGALIILLNGGVKASQDRDISRAKRLAKEADDGIEGLPI